MTKQTTIEITGKIVEMLSPLGSEERQRIISASLALLGETTPIRTKAVATGQEGHETNALTPRPQRWMKQHNLSLDQLLQVFHIADGKAEVIEASPGKDTKERVLNAYVLTGIASLLATGEPNFDDKTARTTCKSSGCYDPNNHATYLKGKGNEFAGSKEKGWTLTAPGLAHGAELVQLLGK